MSAAVGRACRTPSSAARTHHRWLRTAPAAASLAVLLLAWVHPPHGIGLQVCVLRGTIGLPCPGCGLTRSLSCAVRGDLGASWAYHALGPLIVLILVTLAVTGLSRGSLRRWLERFIDRRHRAIDAAYFAFVAAFVLYGAARAAMSAAGLHIAH